MYDSNMNDTTTTAADTTVEAITRMNAIATEAGLETYQQLRGDKEMAERARERTQQINRAYQVKMDNVHEWIKDTVMAGSYDIEEVRDLAESIGFDMVVSKTLKITLEVEIDVPLGSDMNDLDDDAVDITVRGNEDYEVTGWEVTDCECEDA